MCIEWSVTLKNKTNPLHPQWLSCQEKNKTLIFTFAFNYKTFKLLARHRHSMTSYCSGNRNCLIIETVQVFGGFKKGVNVFLSAG